MPTTSAIRNPDLAPQGRQKIDWVKRHMPVLNELEKEFTAMQTFKGQRLLLCLHLEAKTAYLAEILHAAGAEVTVVASNPLSTQDDVVAALVAEGIRAFAWRGATEEEYFNHIRQALEFRPGIIIDDGADVITLLHRERTDLLSSIIGACEETTTGLLRLRALAREGKLAFPVIAVNDAYMKYLFDNRYGTGQSVWDGIMHTTNLSVAGKTVVVAGYGWCGKGVAMRARGLGARVIVTEVDPIKACEALMDGFEVKTMQEAAPEGDFFITVTGNIEVIKREHMEVMKDGAILANAGHFDVEISKPDLQNLASRYRQVRENIEEFYLPDGRRLYLLAEGRLVNLAAGNGHPAEVMDMSFALQALSVKYLLQDGHQLSPAVYNVPAKIDQRVARLRLAALGIKIDILTPAQEKYLASWQ